MKKKIDEKYWMFGVSLVLVYILGSVVDWGYVFVFFNILFILGFKVVQVVKYF